jgi:hypothetical protein
MTGAKIRYDAEIIEDIIAKQREEITQLKNTLKEMVEGLEFYGDPTNNEKEWLEDYSYYSPYLPLRVTKNSHGKCARALLQKHKELIGGLK